MQKLTTQQGNLELNFIKKLENAKKEYQPEQKLEGIIAIKEIDVRDKFIISIYKPTKNKIKTANYNKLTLSIRTKTGIMLLRIDLTTVTHRNPNGNLISGNHIHFYDEVHIDKIATELDTVKEFQDFESKSFVEKVNIFTNYCKIRDRIKFFENNYVL
jgi:hypothetical protein